MLRAEGLKGQEGAVTECLSTARWGFKLQLKCADRNGVDTASRVGMWFKVWG